MPTAKHEQQDRALGLDQSITRRDFLNSTLLTSGACLAPSNPLELLAQAPAAQDWK